ncbi:MAG: glycerophosphodiester phosphodiesterase family protein [Acidimicrobiales bacterium]
MVRPGSWPFLDWPHPIPFAHRGGAAEKPENTMAAFAAAVEAGYTYLETDVRTSSDGVLVALHDLDLARVADRPETVSELPWAELAEVRVQGEPIALLEDILGTWPRARVNIDAKHDACVAALVGAVDRTASHERVCLGSFSRSRVQQIRALTGGRVCTWMGTADIVGLRLASLGLPVPRSAAICAQVPRARNRFPVVDARFVAAAHRRGHVVQVWTVDDRAAIEQLLDLGVDGIFSDRTTLLKEVFTERGLWVSA